jgi:hypothetical protein
MTSRRSNRVHGADPAPISGHIGDTKRFRGNVLDPKTAIQQGIYSAAGRIRTCDPRIKSPLLCQLSYGGPWAMIAHGRELWRST